MFYSWPKPRFNSEREKVENTLLLYLETTDNARGAFSDSGAPRKREQNPLEKKANKKKQVLMPSNSLAPLIHGEVINDELLWLFIGHHEGQEC